MNRKRRIKGSKAELNVPFIAELMGIKVNKARYLLKKFDTLTVDQLGELIWAVRTKERIKKLEMPETKQIIKEIL